MVDLWQDPCETTNLISEEPKLLETLGGKVNSYFDQFVPSREQSVDPEANPHYCNRTWLDENGCYLDTTTAINSYNKFNVT